MWGPRDSNEQTLLQRTTNCNASLQTGTAIHYNVERGERSGGLELKYFNWLI